VKTENKKRIKMKGEAGFTLMEMMVALGVFSTIVTITASIFLGTLRDARYVSSQAAAVDNAGLIIEQIAREVRTGSSFSVPNGTSDRLEFINYHSRFTRYMFSEIGGKKRISKCEGASCAGNSDPGEPLTSESIDVEGSFHITDFSGDPNGRTTPRITVVAGVKDARGNPLTNIQTTISARLIYYKD
jgi:prepilin-type N-terminal cleavage/methylation domain-containing protein